MAFLNINKKKKKILYEQFKQVQEEILQQQIQKQVVKEPEETRLSKKKERKKGKEKKPFFAQASPILIAVCSLENSTGCTHVSKSLAYYIKNVVKKNVCIIDIKGRLQASEINCIPVYQRAEIYNLFNKYQYIILDIGVYDMEFHKEIMLSPIKILISLLNDVYLQELYAFIHEDETKRAWKFCFNHVPENKKKRVDDLMEDYEHWCFPVCDGKSFDKTTQKIFHRLVNGERI